MNGHKKHNISPCALPPPYTSRHFESRIRWMEFLCFSWQRKVFPLASFWRLFPFDCDRAASSPSVVSFFFEYRFLNLILAMLFISMPLVGQTSFVERQIYANLGNVNPSGLPQIRIPLGNNTELARFEFVFAMSHNVIPGHNGSACTEWRISGLRTCVYLDGNEDLVWIRPDMQRLMFKKEDNYQQARMSWSAAIRNAMQDVEFTNRIGQKWTYSGGFLKKISDRFAALDFITAQETILAASKRDRAGNDVVLMRTEYSGEGLLARLKLGQSSSIVFHWSSAAVLVSMEGLPAGRMSFDYENMLLREWNGNGKRTNYTWTACDGLAKNISFGMAPVRLQSDSEFRYEYDKADDVNILRVFRHDGSFMSETRFGVRGIIQKSGGKTTIYQRKS
jgi:hypothetical protein